MVQAGYFPHIFAHSYSPARFQPYLVGLGLGYLLYKMRDQPKLSLNHMALASVWALAFLVGFLVVYGLVPYQKDPTLDASLAERAIYGGFHRLAWALALSWVILACIKGAGGPVNSILSCPAWVPLARMSFAIYLVHRTVMNVVNSYVSFRVTASQVSVLSLYLALSPLSGPHPLLPYLCHGHLHRNLLCTHRVV